jgi:hypothetical protein
MAFVVKRPPALSVALLVAGLCALGAPAAAAPPDPVSKARALANGAGDLLDQKKYAEALARVEEAEGIFHAPTHLLMKSEALLGLGRLVDAMGALEKLAAEPLPRGAPQAFRRAQQEATQRLAELVARVPSVLVKVGGSKASGAKVTLDGAPIDLAGGLAVRADPGAHELRVEAPGAATVVRKLTLPDHGGVVDVAVALEPAAAPEPLTQPPTPPEEPAKPSFWRTRTPAYVALGLGGAGVLVGAITGGVSLGKVSALEARCPNGACAPSDQGAIDSAGALGTTSTVAFTVGAVALAAGAVLFVVNKPPKKEPDAAGLHLTASGLAGTF